MSGQGQPQQQQQQKRSRTRPPRSKRAQGNKVMQQRPSLSQAPSGYSSEASSPGNGRAQPPVTWDEFFANGGNSRVSGFVDKWDDPNLGMGNFGDPWPEDSHPSRYGPPPDAEMSLRLDLNIDVHVEIKAKVHGDVTLSLLD